MITRAQIRRQLRKNGGIMNTVPRTGYFLGGIKDRIRKLIPNEIANVAVKAAPFVAPFNPGIAGLMRGIGRFDQRGSLSDALKQGLLTTAGGAGARYLGGQRGMEDIMGGGLRGGFTNPISSDSPLRNLFKSRELNEKEKIEKAIRDKKSIEKIEDADGNIYTEVPYLAQDTVFEDIENTAANDPELYGFNQQTPYLLKLKKVPRRFISRFKTDNTLEIQFGAGTSDKSDEEIIPNPDNVGLGIKDGRTKLDLAYDPSNFLYTKAYGQVPSNTTLTVTYVVGGGLESNVASNTITKIGTLNVTNQANLNAALLNFIKSSVTSTNAHAAIGGGGGDTTEEIRLNTMANFSAQQRTVTKDDYLIRTLSMPPRFGRIAKAYITQDDQISPLTTEPNRIPNPLALNLYTLGYNQDKKLTPLNIATKQNLSTYLEQFRMLTDAVNIKDAFVINFSVEFEITAYKTYNNQEVILNCISELQSYFNVDKWQVNQPIIVSEVKNLIGGVLGVQTVEDVKIENKSGTAGGYSQYKYDFDSATKKGVIYPSLDPSIFELKYPNSDIKGRVTTY